MYFICKTPKVCLYVACRIATFQQWCLQCTMAGDECMFGMVFVQEGWAAVAEEVVCVALATHRPLQVCHTPPSACHT